jgi:hypothetical protein
VHRGCLSCRVVSCRVVLYRLILSFSSVWCCWDRLVSLRTSTTIAAAAAITASAAAEGIIYSKHLQKSRQAGRKSSQRRVGSNELDLTARYYRSECVVVDHEGLQRHPVSQS